MTMIDKEMLLQRINTQFWSEIENIIISAPSIDIVTCYMCKYSHITYDGQCKYCDNITDDDGNVVEVYYDGSHFCSDGERRDSEKPNNSTQGTGDCKHCSRLFVDCDGR